ncbi:MAG: hypothetical protein QOK40_2633, partial [Miltoncostaeaceae bacterium]|nr:hypothetical protein [Miltoncostaeaceae bacterium]
MPDAMRDLATFLPFAAARRAARAVPAVVAAAGALVSAAPAPPAAAAAFPDFRPVVRSLSVHERSDMTPSVWRRGCPVSLSSLRRVSLQFVGFDGRLRRGALVVHESAARDVVSVFRTLYLARFPIRRMRPIEA